MRALAVLLTLLAGAACCSVALTSPALAGEDTWDWSQWDARRLEAGVAANATEPVAEPGPFPTVPEPAVAEPAIAEPAGAEPVVAEPKAAPKPVAKAAPVVAPEPQASSPSVARPEPAAVPESVVAAKAIPEAAPEAIPTREPQRSTTTRPLRTSGPVKAAIPDVPEPKAQPAPESKPDMQPVPEPQPVDDPAPAVAVEPLPEPVRRTTTVSNGSEKEYRIKLPKKYAAQAAEETRPEATPTAEVEPEPVVKAAAEPVAEPVMEAQPAPEPTPVVAQPEPQTEPEPEIGPTVAEMAPEPAPEPAVEPAPAMTAEPQADPVTQEAAEVETDPVAAIAENVRALAMATPAPAAPATPLPAPRNYSDEEIIHFLSLACFNHKEQTAFDLGGVPPKPQVVTRWETSLRLRVVGTMAPEHKALLEEVVHVLNRTLEESGSRVRMGLHDTDANVTVHLFPKAPSADLPAYSELEYGEDLHPDRAALVLYGDTLDKQVLFRELLHTLGLPGYSYGMEQTFMRARRVGGDGYPAMDLMALRTLYRNELEAGMTLREAKERLAYLKPLEP